MNSVNIYNKENWKKLITIGVATEGLVRIEWADHRYGQIIPVNWQCANMTVPYTPEQFPKFNVIGFSVADAYNTIARHAIRLDSEWVMFIEDDVLIPHDCFLSFNKYMEEKKYPVVSGLYYTRTLPARPLVFRGRGNGCFSEWKMGDVVFCDGIPFGCLLIHMSIIRYLWDNSEAYRAPNGDSLRKVFETPRRRFYDPESESYTTQVGTQDLYWCDRIIGENVFSETGWDAQANMKYPFVCDTSIFCYHIDRQTGKQFPVGGVSNEKK